MEEKVKMLEQEIVNLKAQIEELKTKKSAPSLDVNTITNFINGLSKNAGTMRANRSASHTPSKTYDKEQMQEFLKKIRERRAARGANSTTTPAPTNETNEEVVEFEEVK